ncbi:MAG: hypothetical protein HHJ11_09810 [Phycicoccus sp.]|nr:hypothetical protein [Phycicoccus sp.]NMM33379.1 hypothetical protein [Phycicoccus sp.]
MSSDTTEVNADDAALLPRDVLQNSLDSMADWAAQINERERVLDQLLQASPGGRRGSRRQGLGSHFGRHREEA